MDWKSQTKIKVRFADVDMMGHLNNAKYVTYLEEGRVAYFQKFPELDFTVVNTESRDSVIVASLKLDYRSPAYLNETLCVALRTKEIRRSSFTIEYEIREEKSGRLVAAAETVMVYFDYKAQKSLEIPENLRKRFETLEGREFPKP
ncbi:MAG: acyl-CoA thioesterase [Deltaproteobacteria bacterium]|nr:acyl-CoA thioesterase [Deltaproteobacteria bacterium]